MVISGFLDLALKLVRGAGLSRARRQGFVANMQPSRPLDPRPAESRPRLNIAFVLARRFTLSAYANFVDVLRLAADEGDRSRPILCRWTILAADRTPIPASCGTRIEPDARPEDPRQFDYVVVIGGLAVILFQYKLPPLAAVAGLVAACVVHPLAFRFKG